ncbi:hypothetical protein [Halobacillus litoralis]|nr:hypothetical protein [Halobacillus litoralis]MYL37431.1 hypothetical protein [Halobacillus litoralis]
MVTPAGTASRRSTWSNGFLTKSAEAVPRQASADKRNVPSPHDKWTTLTG